MFDLGIKLDPKYILGNTLTIGQTMKKLNYETLCSLTMSALGWYLCSQVVLYWTSFCPRYRTDAQPQPDFLAGLTRRLQCVAHALGELKIWPVSTHLIFPSFSRSPIKFLP